MSIEMLLNEDDYSQIVKLSEEGNELFNKDDFDGALKKFLNALNVIPYPKNKWQASTWLYASIGDIYYFKEEYILATENFYHALNCPDGFQTAFIHLRLGESLLELGQEENALEHLISAYMLEGEEIFKEEEDAYLTFLKENVEL